MPLSFLAMDVGETRSPKQCRGYSCCCYVALKPSWVNSSLVTVGLRNGTLYNSLTQAICSVCDLRSFLS